MPKSELNAKNATSTKVHTKVYTKVFTKVHTKRNMDVSGNHETVLSWTHYHY